MPEHHLGRRRRQSKLPPVRRLFTLAIALAAVARLLTLGEPAPPPRPAATPFPTVAPTWSGPTPVDVAGVLADGATYTQPRSETEISFEYPDQVESPDIGKNQGLEANDTDTVRSVLGYRLFIPGTVIIEQTLPGNHYYALFFGTSPMSDKKTRCFT